MLSALTPDELSSRFRGALLGGAVGDALGAAIEFTARPELYLRYGPAGLEDYAEIYGRRGAITDDTQMALFTADGLIRHAGAIASGRQVAMPVALHHAYLRWLHTQAVRSAHADYDDALDGWLIRVPTLHSQRAPAMTCLSALRLPHMGSLRHPINDSQDCGGITRIAPVGLFGERSFAVGCQACAITHGHPNATLAAGTFAAIITEVVGGTPLGPAIAQVRQMHGQALDGEVLRAIDSALEAAAVAPVGPDTVERLGGGWAAHEALAIALYCSLVATDFTRGLLLAVNHSGNSDATGTLTGNLLGAAWGVSAIEDRWINELELRDEITEVADDLVAAHLRWPTDRARYPEP